LALLDEIRERLEFIKAAIRIQRGIRKFLLRRKKKKAEIWLKYLHMCAEIIQKNWRRYSCRKKYSTIIEEVRNNRKLCILACVRGWKTRRVLKSLVLQSLRRNISSVDDQAKKVLKEELASTFHIMYITGSWAKRPKEKPKPFLRKSQRDIANSKVRSNTQSREVVFAEAMLKNSQEIAVPRYTESKSYAEMETIPGISYRSKSQAPIILESNPPQITNKEFLKRKSKQIQMQKLSWGHVNRRIDCWVEKESVYNRNKPEKPHLLYPKSSSKPSIHYTKDPDSSSTASTTPNDILSSPPTKPKQIHFARSPRAHSQVVSLKLPSLPKSPRNLPSTPNSSDGKTLASPRPRVRVKPIRGKNTLLSLEEIELLYVDDLVLFSPWASSPVQGSIPTLLPNSGMLCISESEIVNKLESLRVEYDRLCTN
jgi:hypothetical protein